MGSALHATPVHLRASYRARWQRGAFYDAPARIERVSDALEDSFGRYLGEIVHRALQTWRRGLSDEATRQALRAYSWEAGIVEPDALKRVEDEAFKLLRWALGSDVQGWIERAAELHRELPFSYPVNGRVVHGRIDVLLRTPAGEWRVIDYKTGWLKDAADPAVRAEHMRRYHLQMGMYADSVEKLIGAPVEVYIHYIRHGFTDRIDRQSWRAALDALDDTLDVLTEDIDLSVTPG
jgi:ATP-dependent exoDNAse (exonuclease V) beta subunit